MVSLEQEVEIVVGVPQLKFVENIIRSLKSSGIRSDLVWMKKPSKVLDFVRSQGEFEGNTINSDPKIFVLDADCGLDQCKRTMRAIKSKEELNSSVFFVLANALREEERIDFIKAGMTLIDDSFNIRSF